MFENLLNSLSKDELIKIIEAIQFEFESKIKIYKKCIMYYTTLLECLNCHKIIDKDECNHMPNLNNFDKNVLQRTKMYILWF